MGHCIGFRVCEKKEDIMGECREFAFMNTDRGENRSGSYHGNMTIIDGKICDDERAAREYLEEKSRNGFYSDYAVQFHDISAVKIESKKIGALRERIKKLQDDKAAYVKAHAMETHSANLIGCPHCGSKLAKEYIAKHHTNRCFVCGKDMRAQYIIDRERKYDTDAEELCQKLRAERLKSASKAPIKWLAKIEVHC